MWISINKLLPEINRVVFLLTDKGYNYVGYINSKGEWISIAEGVSSEVLLSNVEYWMPIPDIENNEEKERRN